MTAVVYRFRDRGELTYAEMIDLLDEAVARLATGRRGSAGVSAGSRPPAMLTAMVVRERFIARHDEAAVWEDVERFLDGRARMPAGDCWRCRSAVLAYPDETLADCDACLAQVDVEQNRRRALDTALRRRLTAAEIERESPRYGARIKASRVRTWAWRGRIVADDQLRYSLAEVLRLAEG